MAVEIKGQQMDTEAKRVWSGTNYTSSEPTTPPTEIIDDIPLKKSPTTCDIQFKTTEDINKQSRNEDGVCHISTMPPGWVREVRQRKAGKTAGKLDVYITR